MRRVITSIARAIHLPKAMKPGLPRTFTCQTQAPMLNYLQMARFCSKKDKNHLHDHSEPTKAEPKQAGTSLGLAIGEVKDVTEPNAKLEQRFQIEGNTIVAQFENQTVTYQIDDEIKGANLGVEGVSGVYVLMYTCAVCNSKAMRSFTKKAYHTGVVLIRCEGCDKLHLIADNLGWFEDNPINIERIMKEKGQSVMKVSNHPELAAWFNKLPFAKKDKISAAVDASSAQATAKSPETSSTQQKNEGK